MARETVLFTLPPELSEQVVLDELERAGHRFGAQVEKVCLILKWYSIKHKYPFLTSPFKYPSECSHVQL